MAYNFIFTFIVTFVFIGIIGFIVNTYLFKGKENKGKVFVIYLVQIFIITVLLTWFI
ncbi:hypothetical protein JDS87_30970 [Bacillus cereus]|uniref:hypothetical protein n=1 Tax=Bacillus cereus TaxID=1396 RepID=UPI0018F2EDC1|nr:hypothetical protein [Bacillus cereus]MBJ8056153.1 hypothetical protein [Bacillus cereus]